MYLEPIVFSAKLLSTNRLIIIEGPQGTGKTTLANYLRENIIMGKL